MNFVEWARGKARKFKWYDMKLAQFSGFFFALILVSAWPAFLDFVLRFD